MVQGTSASLQIERLDGGCSGTSKGSASAMEDEKDENLDCLNQQSAGKPPRNIKMVRQYCSSSAFFTDFIFPLPGAFYGVFDGHGGVDAASFTRKNILNFIVEDSQFPSGTKRAIKSAFVKADHALSDTKSIDSSSGTTALMALVLGRTMLVANAGDSRAVLGKRGRAIELSKDHKPSCASERTRIERLGGVIHDGYLNGQLSVARALGDWHIKGPKGSKSPLSSEPEVEEINLTEEDEFLILGCDGLWDVMSSQCAVTMVRKELMLHNDPEICSKALVTEALERNTCDNLTVLVICFSPDPPPKIEIPRNHRRRSISAEGLDRVKGILNN
ncbi:hypothetical protein OIU78_020679 [Salix suchowensis]|nr:hypothetical protein OIU78_020679 [Salix suchowensis]